MAAHSRRQSTSLHRFVWHYRANSCRELERRAGWHGKATVPAPYLCERRLCFQTSQSHSRRHTAAALREALMTWEAQCGRGPDHWMRHLAPIVCWLACASILAAQTCMARWRTGLPTLTALHTHGSMASGQMALQREACRTVPSPFHRLEELHDTCSHCGSRRLGVVGARHCWAEDASQDTLHRHSTRTLDSVQPQPSCPDRS
jgi:hypothetical protein